MALVQAKYSPHPSSLQVDGVVSLWEYVFTRFRMKHQIVGVNLGKTKTRCFAFVECFFVWIGKLIGMKSVYSLAKW